MTDGAPRPRPWKDVAREQRYNLRLLSKHVGRTYSTMVQYSGGYRRIPQEVLDKLAELFGEPVQ